LISQAIQTGAAQTCPAVAIIPKNVIIAPHPVVGLAVVPKLFQLLLYGLR